MHAGICWAWQNHGQAMQSIAEVLARPRAYGFVYERVSLLLDFQRFTAVGFVSCCSAAFSPRCFLLI